MFDKQEMSVLEVFNNEIDRIRDQRQISFAKIFTGRFKLTNHLLQLKAFLAANFFKSLFGVFVEPDAEVIKYVRPDAVLVDQVPNPPVFQREFIHELVNIEK